MAPKHVDKHIQTSTYRTCADSVRVKGWRNGGEETDANNWEQGSEQFHGPNDHNNTKPLISKYVRGKNWLTY